MVFSFLVPLNLLFERYLFEVIKSYDCCYTVNYQGSVQYLAKQDGINKLLLKPDITISDNESIKYIIDAKYKEVDIFNNINGQTKKR